MVAFLTSFPCEPQLLSGFLGLPCWFSKEKPGVLVTPLCQVFPQLCLYFWSQMMGEQERSETVGAHPNLLGPQLLQSVRKGPRDWASVGFSPSFLLRPGDCLWPGVWENREDKETKKTKGLYPLSLTLGIPFLILSWDRTKGLLPGLSLSAFDAHFQVWGCSEFKPGEYHMWKYGKLNTGLVVLQILVIPTLSATVHGLESLHICSVHSLQVLELHLPGEAGWGMPTPAVLEPKPKTTLSDKLNWVCQ